MFVTSPYTLLLYLPTELISIKPRLHHIITFLLSPSEFLHFLH